MFSDGTVVSIVPGEYSENDITRVDANTKSVERGAVVNHTLINLSDKLLMTPEDLNAFEIGQLKRFLQFHLDAYPNAAKANELTEYIQKLEEKRQGLKGDQLESAVELNAIETLLAE